MLLKLFNITLLLLALMTTVSATDSRTLSWSLTQGSTSGLEENSMEFLLNCSLLYIQVYYLFLFKLQAVHQLLVQLQSMSVLFIASCYSQDNS